MSVKRTNRPTLQDFQQINFVNLVNSFKLFVMEKKEMVPTATRVEADLHEAAHKKARSQGRTLSAILRAFMVGWVKGEIPDPPFGLEWTSDGEDPEE